jgi:hypothetical protein
VCYRSAAGESDVLFVKVVPGGHNDLYDYCKQQGVHFLPFMHFKQAHLDFFLPECDAHSLTSGRLYSHKVRDVMRDVVEGKITMADIQTGKV